MPGEVSDVPAAVSGGGAGANALAPRSGGAGANALAPRSGGAGANGPAPRGPAQGPVRPGLNRVSPRTLGEWAAVAAPGLALLLADGHDLGRVSLWRDEAYTLSASHRALAEIFALSSHTDAANTVYYLAVHASIGVFGTSEVALRLPSLLAMAVAAVMTALIGRRLARAVHLPAPAVTGLIAGLLFVAAPQVTRYAQEARSYGLVTMFATIATYLLLRATDDGRWRWWAAYGGAIALMAGFNLLAFLLVAAHAVTVLAGRFRSRAGQPPARHGEGAEPPPAAAPAGAPPVRVTRWLAAVVAALAVLTPLIVLGIRQGGQISWLHRPRLPAVLHLISGFSGSRPLVPVIAVLVVIAVLACLAGPRAPYDVVTVALAWLVLPPAVLLVFSQVHPVYDARYVIFCLPALALLEAAGLASLARLTGMLALPWVRGAVTWVPAAIVVMIVAALLIGPQQEVRSPSSRPDNLRAASAIVAAREHPGDAVLYLPGTRRAFAMAYPQPFLRLRDIALAQPPAAADNLLGTTVSASTLRRRFAGVHRVWLVTQASRHKFPAPENRLQAAEISLLRQLRLAGRWHAGDVLLSLFTRP